MSARRHPERRAPRTLRVRGRRLAGVVLTAVLVPSLLGACGLIGGQSNHGAAPVEISAGDAGAPTGSPGSGSLATSPTGSGSAVATTQNTTQVVVSGGVTVTKTGIVVRTQTNTQTKTQIKTQQVIKVSTAPPVTDTQTQTQTVTTTETVTLKTTIQGPTVRCTVLPPAVTC